MRHGSTAVVLLACLMARSPSAGSAPAKGRSVSLAEAVALATERRETTTHARLEQQRLDLARQAVTGTYVPSGYARSGWRRTDPGQDPFLATTDLSALSAELGVEGLLPTGTRYGVEMLHLNTLEDHTATVGMAAVRHSLLRHSYWHQQAVRESAEADIEAARSLLRLAEEDVALEVAQAYWGLSLALRLERIAQVSVGLARKHLRLARSRVKAGLLHELGVVQPEAALAERLAQLETSADRVAYARAHLLTAIAPAPRDPGWWEAPLRPSSEPGRLAALDLLQEAQRQEAIEEHPHVARARHQVAAARQAWEAWRWEAMCDLDVVGELGGAVATIGEEPFLTEFGTHLRRQKPFYFVGLNFRADLGVASADLETQQAAVALRGAEAELDAQRIQVAAKLYYSARSVELRRNALKAQGRALELAAEALAVEERAFAQGRSTSFAVLQLQETLVEAKRQHAIAELEAESALVLLLHARGMLVEALRRAYGPS